MTNVFKIAPIGKNINKISESELLMSSGFPTLRVVKSGIWHIKDSGYSKTVDYVISNHKLGFRPAFMIIHLYDEYVVEAPDPETIIDSKVYKPNGGDAMLFGVDKDNLYYHMESGENVPNWEKKYYYYIFDLDLEEETEYDFKRRIFHSFNEMPSKNVLKIRKNKSIKKSNEKDLAYSSTIKPLLIYSIKQSDFNPDLAAGTEQNNYINHNLGYIPMHISYQRLSGSDRINLMPYYLTTYTGASKEDILIHIINQPGGATENIDKGYIITFLEGGNE